MFKIIIASTALLSLASTAPLRAQDNSHSQMTCPYCGSPLSQSGSNQKLSNPAPNGSTSISGDVISLRQINIRSSRGESKPHAMAQIQLSDGRRTMVDLGTVNAAQGLGLQQGDYIQVRGQQKSLHGQSVLVAQQIRHEGQNYTLRRSQASPAQFGSRNQSRQHQPTSPNQPQTSSQIYNLSGTIEGFRHLNLRNAMGERDQHSLVKVTLQNGRTAVVDLGPKRNLGKIDFQQGDRIQVKGQRGRVDGRPVLMASQVRVGDQTIEINRSPRLEQAGSFKIQGTVEGYQLTTVGTGTNQQALLKLRLMDGRSILIDAGQQYTVGEFNLKNLNLLDKVTIEGERKNVQGRQILVANKIEFQDQPAPRDREYTRERQPDSAGEQAQPSQQSGEESSRSGESPSSHEAVPSMK